MPSYFRIESDMIISLQLYQKALKVDPSYKPAAECLAIVWTDLGTSLKLSGNTEEGLQKYFEALKVDSHYAVKSHLLFPLLLFLSTSCFYPIFLIFWML